MSHANGEVRFNDGGIKHFEYNGTSDICIPELYDSYEDVIYTNGIPDWAEKSYD